MSHYNETYFKYQKKIGSFGGLANKFKFQRFISKDDYVLDYGCGGGFLLDQLACKKKIGFEINNIAKKYLRENFKFSVVDKMIELEDNSLDLVISNHCLEHVSNPINVISQLYNKIKKNGKIVIYVPHDKYNYRFSNSDIDNHYYSFSPSNLGNIIKECGFEIIELGTLLHRWPPYYLKIYKLFGLNIFHFLSRIYGLLDRRRTQSFVVGIKHGI
jgi:SAM-dependent methyltransferase